jgi:hypothetical protein
MPTLKEALRDVGKSLPGPREAALWLARGAARRMLAGEGSAYELSKAIWSIARRVHGQVIASLDPFIYAASEWEERPEDRPFFEKEMLKAAEDLLREDSRNAPGAGTPSQPR